MSTFILIAIIVTAFVIIFFRFNYYSATKGMVRSNLDAFFVATSQGMNSEDAMHYMIFTRYGSFPKKRGEFIPLYALFLSYLENPETSGKDFPDAFGVLGIILSSFHLHHEIPEDRREKEDLEMLRCVISLMHIYESGAIYKSPQSYGFPTVKVIDKFLYTIDQEYYKRTGKFRSR